MKVPDAFMRGILSNNFESVFRGTSEQSSGPSTKKASIILADSSKSPPHQKASHDNHHLS